VVEQTNEDYTADGFTARPPQQLQGLQHRRNKSYNTELWGWAYGQECISIYTNSEKGAC